MKTGMWMCGGSCLAAIVRVVGIGGLIKAGYPWAIVWSDEFNGPANSPVDPAKWKFDAGATGWGNHELEEYTSSTENVFLDGSGHLLIRALRKGGAYTSGRIKTAELFEFQEGRVEARIKIPYGQGLWPAFWMLGSDISRVGWPRSGEIDIMENIGKEPSTVHGTLHGPGYSGSAGIAARFDLPGGARLCDDFHVFKVEWSAHAIELFVDGSRYARVTPENLPPGKPWVYNHSFFLLLNLAIGGDWPGKPDDSTVFPQSMLVDWVRVWKRATVLR